MKTNRKNAPSSFFSANVFFISFLLQKTFKKKAEKRYIFLLKTKTKKTHSNFKWGKKKHVEKATFVREKRVFSKNKICVFYLRHTIFLK